MVWMSMGMSAVKESKSLPVDELSKSGRLSDRRIWRYALITRALQWKRSVLKAGQISVKSIVAIPLTN